MRRLHARPIQVTVLALLVAGAAVVALAAAVGFRAFADAFSNLHLAWLPVTAIAALLAVPAYVLPHRVVARLEGGPRIPLGPVACVVMAGFGPAAAAGGFVLDKWTLHALEGDERRATERVLGLGALEWALLAPAAWISAVLLLLDDDPRPMASLLWPWAIAVPVGFAFGFWLAVPSRRERIEAGGGRWRRGLGQALRGVGMLGTLARGFRTSWTAWVGMALYWALELASFYSAARFIGLHLNLGELTLAYATGYALTRRSLPLAGAGVTELLLSVSLHWVGQPLAPALAVTVVYRFFNFVLPILPSLLVHPRVEPLLDAAERRRSLARRARRRSPAPSRAGSNSRT